MRSLTVKHDSTIKLTVEQCNSLGIDTNADEIHGTLKTFGIWNIPVSYKALCIDTSYVNIDGLIKPTEITFFGNRTMINIRQGGYNIEGYVSIKGKKYTCFDSSILIEVNGKLINVACISARYTKYPKN
jgi:hypothetical protein